MRTSTIFWGTLLIFLGLFFLLGNFGIFGVKPGTVFDLWPLLLIVWGVSLLKIPPVTKKIMAGLSALLIALLITSLFFHKWSFPFCDWDFNDNECTERIHSDSCTNTLSLPYDSTYINARLNFSGGAGEISFYGTSTKLLDVFTNGDKENISLKLDTAMGNINIDLLYEPNKHVFKHFSNREVDVKLNPNPVWDMNLKVGASDCEFDLSNYKIKNLKLEVGAADIDLRLGDLQDRIDLEIDAGACSVTIEIPRTSGCEVTANTGLSSKDFEDFNKIDSETFRTENFNNSSKKIFIKFKGGVSSFEVERY